MTNLLHDYHLSEKNFFSVLSITQETFGFITAFATGVKAADLNPAIVHQLDDSFETSLNTAYSFYTRKNLPWSLVIPEQSCSQNIEEIIKRRNLILSDTSMTMSLNLDGLQIPITLSPLNIIEMQQDLSVWSIPLIHGFESTPEICEIYSIRHQAALNEQDNLYHFSGFIGDTVVCSLSLSIIGHNARLDDIATMPRYQKNGYATQLILAALRFALKLNAKYCFLEASSSGLSMYKKIGFNDLYANHHYELQDV